MILKEFKYGYGAISHRIEPFIFAIHRRQDPHQTRANFTSTRKSYSFIEYDFYHLF
ncbi:Hypothetical protein Y17_2857 [Pectobacterium wasabiae CFBP 3304]|nr:Hypothetical protein Y17_2857 [Pectobacterium wasabiae CFBP 3304]